MGKHASADSSIDVRVLQLLLGGCYGLIMHFIRTMKLTMYRYQYY